VPGFTYGGTTLFSAPLLTHRVFKTFSQQGRFFLFLPRPPPGVVHSKSISAQSIPLPLIRPFSTTTALTHQPTSSPFPHFVCRRNCFQGIVAGASVFAFSLDPTWNSPPRPLPVLFRIFRVIGWLRPPLTSALFDSFSLRTSSDLDIPSGCRLPLPLNLLQVF